MMVWMLMALLGTSEHESVDRRVEVAEEYVLETLCPDDECRERRRDAIAESVGKIVRVCDAHGLTDDWCMALVVTATGEGGMQEHPTCAGLDPLCAQDCDRLFFGEERSVCLSGCALVHGQVKAAGRARRCNDRGTSRGPFQMKPGTIAKCRQLVGPIDPHRIDEAAFCYVELVRSSQQIIPSACGLPSSRWMVAWKRVGAGPTVRDTGAQQCNVSQYARMGAKLAKRLQPLRALQPPEVR